MTIFHDIPAHDEGTPEGLEDIAAGGKDAPAATLEEIATLEAIHGAVAYSGALAEMAPALFSAARELSQLHSVCAEQQLNLEHARNELVQLRASHTEEAWDELSAENKALREKLAACEKDSIRLEAMMPLFEEARDALPAISLSQAKMHGVSLDLADRMDAVGIPERWNAAISERGSNT